MSPSEARVEDGDLTPTAAPLEISGAPYPGLRPFKREESDIFFGRDELVDGLLSRLGRARFLGLVGVSGCGKSSLLRAGLMPALETGFLAKAGVRWTVAEMRPGYRPMRELARVLAKRLPQTGEPAGLDPAPFIEDTLRRGPLGLREVLHDYQFPPQTNLLLVVDQFEEIFRYRREVNSNEADAFVALLLESARQTEFPVYVVLGMRSDYLGECALFQGLPEALNDSQFLTPRLTRDQRREAIEGPAGVFGATIERALVNQLLNDMGASPDQLPVLQHLLMRMWNRALARGDKEIVLGLEDYQAVGGFGEALSRHVDEVYDSLPTNEHRRIAEVLFRTTTERQENKLDSRRPAKLRIIAEIAGVHWSKVAEVVEAFRQPGNSFLLPPDGVPLDEDSLIDITHESLIRQWHRLSDWVRDESLRAENYRKIEDGAQSWLKRGKKWRWLLRPPELDEALDWRAVAKPMPAWAERYGGDLELVREFLHKSKRRRLLLRCLYALLFLALVGSVAAFAVKRRRDELARQEEAIAQAKAAEEAKKQQERIANSYDLASQATLARTLKLGQLQASALLGAEAVKRSPSVQSSQALRESLRLIPETVTTVPAKWVVSAFVAPDGARVLAQTENTIESFDIGTSQSTVVWKSEADVTLRAVSVDGRYFALADDKNVFVVETSSGRPMGRGIANPQNDIEQISVSADGKRIASVTERQIRVDGTDGKRARTLPRASDSMVRIGPQAGVAVAWDGDDRRLIAINLQTGGLVRSYPFTTEITSLSISPDELYVAAATREGLVRVYSIKDLKEITRVQLSAYSMTVRNVILGWDAAYLAIVAREATRIFDLRDRKQAPEIERIETFGVPISLSLTPDGSRVAAVGRQGLGVWNLTGGAEVTRVVLDAPATQAVLSPDKRYLATASVKASEDEKAPTSQVNVWSVSNGAKVSALPIRGRIDGLVFTPDSSRLLAAAKDAKVRSIPVPAAFSVGPVDARNRPAELESHERAFDCGQHSLFAGFSADGSRVAVTASDGSLCVFDTSDGKLLHKLSSARGRVALSRDGAFVALVAHDRLLRSFSFDQRENRASGRTPDMSTSSGPDAATLEKLLELETTPVSLAISPRGSYVAAGTWQPGVQVVPAKAPRPFPIKHDSSVAALAFSGDERFLLTGGRDGNLRVWYLPPERQEAAEVMRIALRDPISTVGFSEDGEYAVVASDRSVRVLRWRWDDLIRETCRRVSGPLSDEERAQFMLPNDGIEAACARTSPSAAQSDPLAEAQALLSKGQVTAALERYRSAEAAGQEVGGEQWNDLCYSGSLRGYPRAVLFACDKAVNLDENDPDPRDSRGVARALLGDREGALADFRFFVENTDRDHYKAQRQRWIAALEHGEDPITMDEVRDELDVDDR